MVLLSAAESQDMDVDKYEAIRNTLSLSWLKLKPRQVHEGHQGLILSKLDDRIHHKFKAHSAFLKKIVACGGSVSLHIIGGRIEVRYIGPPI